MVMNPKHNVRVDLVAILSRYNDKIVLLRDTFHQISRGESAATDSPREIWWTVSRNYTVFFLIPCSQKY